jgi:histidinol phosphatase-like PHP family hydrolase
MENLNAEQVKKALECWASGKPCEGGVCDLFDASTFTCDRWTGKNALALITSQEQRIAELTEEVAVKVVTLIELDKQIKRLTEENERLVTALANYDRQTDVRIAEEYYTAEAYEELREENERLNETLKLYRKYNTAIKAERANTVKQLSKKLINHFDECGAFTDMETDFIALEIDNVAEEFLRGR